MNAVAPPKSHELGKCHVLGGTSLKNDALLDVLRFCEIAFFTMRVFCGMCDLKCMFFVVFV